MANPDIEVRGLRDDEAHLYERMVGKRGGTPIEYYLSHYDGLGGGWNNSRVVLSDGQIVSHVRLYDRVVRWGTATIHCGGMADVYTRPECRRKGYGRLLLEDALRQYESWSCGLSMISSGVVEFYASKGWDRYPTYRFDVQIRPEWHQPIPEYHVRRFDRFEDLEAVADIHAECNQNSPLTLVRDARYWQKHFSWCRREQEYAFYVAEHAGEIVGYMRADLRTIWEIGYRLGHEASALALLEAEVRLMASRGTEQFSIYLPWQSPLIEFLKKLRCTTTLVETTLLRVVDLVHLLQAMLPDFEKQLEQWDHSVVPVGHVGLSTDGHQATVSVQAGKVSVTSGIVEGADVLNLSQRHLFNLLTGSDEYVPLNLPGPARNLAQTLFPKRNPMWWPIDTV